MPDVGLAAELGADLQAALDQHRTDRNIPGIGAAVIFPDGSIWSGGSGDARLDPQEAATADTPFVVGSITKTFVTAAVMQLSDEGQLSLDEPISTWLPDYPNAENITVRQLLNHRSGIYNYFEHPTYELQVFGTMRGHSWTPQEILDTFVLEPYFEPGADYHYSNTNFILLGLIIEQITGQSLGDVLAERYFGPLGLADTYFQGNGPPPPTAATGYLVRPTGFRAVDDETDYQPTVSAATVAWAAGAIDGSARDMAIWGDALYGGHVVSPDALAQMEDLDLLPANRRDVRPGHAQPGVRRRADVRPHRFDSRIRRGNVALQAVEHDHRHAHQPRPDRRESGDRCACWSRAERRP